MDNKDHTDKVTTRMVSVLDLDYNRYPENPFSRTTAQKWIILLNQIDDINNRILGTPDMMKFMTDYNDTLWEEWGELHKVISDDDSEKWKTNINNMKEWSSSLEDQDTIHFRFDMKANVDWENSDMFKKFEDSAGKFLPYGYLKIRHTGGMAIPESHHKLFDVEGFVPEFTCADKYSITKSDVEVALEYISFQLFSCSIRVRDISIETFFFDIRKFPCMIVTMVGKVKRLEESHD